MKLRNWFLTINYQSSYHPTYQELHAELQRAYKNVRFVAIKREVGTKNNTIHYHILFCLKNAVSFKSVKDNFPRAHIDPAKPKLIELLNYITKNDTKEDKTYINGTLPQKGKRTDLQFIYDMIKDGNSMSDIRELFPDKYLLYMHKIKAVQQEVLSESAADLWVEKEVTYIYGDTGLGKTRYVMDKYGYKNCYRVTNYKNPFDNYDNQPVIIFEEFRSSIKIEDMLIYLDGYPITLPARYSNKIAMYKKVYIVTNIPLFAQYQSIQTNHLETFKALMRRIQHVHFLVPIRKDEGIHTFTFDDPIEALHFSFALDNLILGIKPNKFNNQWFDENRYTGSTTDKIKKLDKIYDLTGYSYQTPELRDKNEPFYTIASSINELKKELVEKIDKNNSDSEVNTDENPHEELTIEDLLK